jgi:tripartite-type tricarboxylate transporter receptor subunit TctC
MRTPILSHTLLGTLAATLAATTLLAGHAHAQSAWPADRPIKIVVPYPPGGSADPVTRLIAQHLGPRLGRTVIVENVAGASGNIGTNQVVRAAPDGHTLVLAATPLSTNPSFYKDIPFDVLTDLATITMITRQQFVLVVHPSVPANSVPELIALAKSKPGQLTSASHSAGGATHLALELFKVLAGVDIVHVPYKGQAPAVSDLLAGHVNMLFDSASTGMTHAATGKLRALATTGPERSKLVADGKLPIMAEFKGMEAFNVIAWYGYMAPAGTPEPILERLSREINAVIHMPEVTERLNKMGFDVVGTTPKEFSAHVRSEVAKWAKVVKDSGAKL